MNGLAGKPLNRLIEEGLERQLPTNIYTQLSGELVNGVEVMCWRGWFGERDKVGNGRESSATHNSSSKNNPSSPSSPARPGHMWEWCGRV